MVFHQVICRLNKNNLFFLRERERELGRIFVFLEERVFFVFCIVYIYFFFFEKIYNTIIQDEEILLFSKEKMFSKKK